MNSNNEPHHWHIVHSEASCGWGGQEIRILTESQAMLERGHRVSLLAPATAPIHAQAQTLGIEVHSLPYEKKSLQAIRASAQWLAQHRPDIINTHSSIDSWMIGLARLRHTIAPVIRTRHISANLRKSYPTRWLYTRSAQGIVTTGQRLADRLIHDLACPIDHVQSVPTGIDLERYHPDKARPGELARQACNIPAHARVIGIAATLRSWKGHTYLFDAFHQLLQSHGSEERPLHLLIIGDGPMRPAYEQTLSAVAHRQRIHLIGHQEQVQDWLNAIDIFALPSYANEGVPQSLMQAMAMNIPVVTTTVGAIGELVDDSTGLLCNRQDSADLAAKIAQHIDQPQQSQTRVQAARQRVQQRYSKTAMADAMEAVFAQAIKHYRAR